MKFYVVTVKTVSQIMDEKDNLKMVKKNIKYLVQSDSIEKACQLAQSKAFIEFDEATTVGAKEFDVYQLLLNEQK